MMQTLYLLNYNNYYNRIVKKEQSIEDYMEYLCKYNGEPVDALGKSSIVEGVNFIENDGVDTTQVVNWGGDKPDYVVVLDEFGGIHSRWFVMHSIRTRVGQLQLSLHRDLIVDHYKAVVTAPAFIEKGTPLTIEESSIFNNENMTFNQIKQSETPIKDETGCPWLVAYMVPTALEEKKIDITRITTNYIETGEPFANWKLYDYTKTYFHSPTRFIFEELSVSPSVFVLNVSTNGPTKTRPVATARISFDSNLNVFDVTWIDDERERIHIGTLFSWSFDGGTIVATPYMEVAQDLVNKLAVIKDKLFDVSRWNENQQSTAVYDPELYAAYKAAIGNTYLFTESTGSVWAYKFDKSSEGPVSSLEPVQFGSALSNAILDTFAADPILITPDDDPEPNKIYFYNDVTSPVAFVLAKGEGTYLTSARIFSNAHLVIPEDVIKVNKTVDGAYSMLCAPYTDDSSVYVNGSSLFTEGVSKDTLLNIFTSLTSVLGTDIVSDVQLLPYCPVRHLLNADGKIVTPSSGFLDITTNFSVGGVTTPRATGRMFWCSSSRFEFSIDLEEPLLPGNTILDKKINNETKMYRLCSPLYDGLFEFSAAKNNGVYKINIDCRYKPLTSYIHLAPDFGGLYGRDFDDARGLTVSGDFSLDQISEAWTEYQIQNKNYQRMFDRQVQNIEITNKVERVQQQWQIAAGVMQGAAQGYQMGSNTMLGLGGILGYGKLGAAAGAGISAAAGMADLKASDMLRKENLSYVKDQFNMQMQNIQALPNTVTKLSAFDMNVRYFPFIEYYTCTKEEVDALKNKIIYSGMTIQRIGTIAQYANPDAPYIQGYLIRVEDKDLDFHIIDAINAELKQGVFLYGYTTINS